MRTYSWEEEIPAHQVLAPDGSVVGEWPESLDDERLRSFYRWMVFARRFDQRALTLHRQGRLGTYAPFSGQEAAQIGSFAALEKTDWVFPSYREVAGMMYHGLPPEMALLFSKGHPDAGKVPAELNMLPGKIVIAAQILHAVGAAWACKQRGEDRVASAFFGDGATSQGDFHEALNFAAVFRVPAVFFCQNNQFAISVPVTRQMATPTVAQKAVAYGIEGIRVDGNDVVAVYAAMCRAVARARAGGGPTLVEAVTYRQGPHTTADDPRRYRDPQVHQTWVEALDPIRRLRLCLERRGAWDEAAESAWIREADERIAAAVERAESYPAPDAAEVLFGHVYAEPTPALAAQRAGFLAEQAEGGANGWPGAR
ncbi:pyruvate dehydrogenase (acetyl-transferring) E1 component subunit alpha [Alicyclobacillus macrosporangiidus]|uniref:Pyruvate dehydrogenase E1 component subunit alpha n=1 Tax=Alicyclobacillus macrosporangiidus TaxID=392015 RepID=A0A1I7L3Z4_9BACL|nr:pyruvate dehydrogenase (acetyl-transferring) E1 component subunit alpha [Alicyclobacillus macrosporangiidus]SFV04459.1 pyruvate dehydrogenase E1 component alpha subunit [Alicyclobacillus macrosporangiidus]